MTDLPATPDEITQIAQSLAIDGSLGRADTMLVVEILRWVARRGWEG